MPWGGYKPWNSIGNSRGPPGGFRGRGRGGYDRDSGFHGGHGPPRGSVISPDERAEFEEFKRMKAAQRSPGGGGGGGGFGPRRRNWNDHREPRRRNWNDFERAPYPRGPQYEAPRKKKKKKIKGPKLGSEEKPDFKFKEKLILSTTKRLEEKYASICNKEIDTETAAEEAVVAAVTKRSDLEVLPNTLEKLQTDCGGKYIRVWFTPKIKRPKALTIRIQTDSEEATEKLLNILEEKKWRARTVTKELLKEWYEKLLEQKKKEEEELKQAKEEELKYEEEQKKAEEADMEEEEEIIGENAEDGTETKTEDADNGGDGDVEDPITADTSSL